MSDYVSYTENDLLYLVDTGCPYSLNYGNSPAGDIIMRFYTGLLDDLTTTLHQPIQGVIGTDQIKQYRWYFNSTTEKLTRVDDAFNLENATAFHLDNHIGLPVITAQINGEDYRLIIDTCSTLLYLKRGYLKGTPSTIIEDYHPMIGTFKTAGYASTITTMKVTEDHLIFDLPIEMEAALGHNTHGILGYNFLKHHDWILDLKHDQLILR